MMGSFKQSVFQVQQGRSTFEFMVIVTAETKPVQAVAKQKSQHGGGG